MQHSATVDFTQTKMVNCTGRASFECDTGSILGSPKAYVYSLPATDMKLLLDEKGDLLDKPPIRTILSFLPRAGELSSVLMR